MRCKWMICCLVCVLCACQTTEKKKGDIVITVDVKQKPEMGFVISYLKEAMRDVEFDENGHGECVIEGMDGLYFTLHNGFAEQKIMYAENGDRIGLTFDGKSMKNTLVVTGGRKPILDYLSEVRLTWPPDESYKLEFSDYLEALEKQVDSNLMLLRSCKQQLDVVSDKFTKLEEYRIRCSMSFMLLQYPEGHRWATKDQNLQVGEEYYDALRKWMVEDPDLLNLYEYRTLMTEGASIIAAQGKRYRNPYERTLMQMKYLAGEVKNEQVKQYLIDLLACRYTNQYGISHIRELDSLYRTEVKDSRLTAGYHRIYEAWEKLQPGCVLPDFIAKDENGKSYSLKDFQGRNVCLFIWQTLYPCLKEYPYLDSLQTTLKAKDITLVCLSIDSERESWLNAIHQKTTSPVVHLYFGPDKDYLNTIRYRGEEMFQLILLDKEGKIINRKLPQPSRGHLKEYLEKVL